MMYNEISDEYVMRKLLTVIDTSDPNFVLMDFDDLERVAKTVQEAAITNRMVLVTASQKQVLDTKQGVLRSVIAEGFLNTCEPAYATGEKEWEKFRDAPVRRRKRR